MSSLAFPHATIHPDLRRGYWPMVLRALQLESPAGAPRRRTFRPGAGSVEPLMSFFFKRVLILALGAVTTPALAADEASPAAPTPSRAVMTGEQVVQILDE